VKKIVAFIVSLSFILGSFGTLPFSEAPKPTLDCGILASDPLPVDQASLTQQNDILQMDALAHSNDVLKRWNIGSSYLVLHPKMGSVFLSSSTHRLSTQFRLGIERPPQL